MAFIWNRAHLKHVLWTAPSTSLLPPPYPSLKSHWQSLIIEIIVHKHIVGVCEERMS